MSELYGRKNPLLISSFGFSIFSVAVAVAKDVQTVFICRFFAGRQAQTYHHHDNPTESI